MGGVGEPSGDLHVANFNPSMTPYTPTSLRCLNYDSLGQHPRRVDHVRRKALCQQVPEPHAGARGSSRGERPLCHFLLQFELDCACLVYS